MPSSSLLAPIQFGALTLALTSGLAQASEREVSLNVPGAELHATLSLPDGAARPPVALILAGSGPTDRNGNSVAGVQTDVYTKLSAALNAAGVATLRADKRGVGQSVPADRREEALTFGDYVNDASAWINWLKADDTLGSVAVIGHSEGALTGLAAALKAPVSAYVSIAGAGENIADTLKRQLQGNANLPPDLFREASQAIDTLRSGQRVESVSAPLMALLRPSVQPYLISWMQLDPAALLAQLQVPALIVQGGRDLQVSVQDARRLAAAQPAAQLALIETMNHVLVDAPEDAAGNIATYSQPALPLNPALVQTLTSFLQRALK
ncbi:alpha/beta hydrolase [Deinococcus irradiatisoli]|uniref:Alpha/beta hydrolase n=1 Tax=Deinococcus irradiatisoli TaxID=2202254 RepID=A0A2Z3JFF3_9DEIO|nr:alpha/beta fold hydrolase [Deinococcus irradiatisoli]AWN23893.1 alpha/beta hydrolase [Deinococcus irradiatisoli]